MAHSKYCDKCEFPSSSVREHRNMLCQCLMNLSCSYSKLSLTYQRHSTRIWANNRPTNTKQVIDRCKTLDKLTTCPIISIQLLQINGILTLLKSNFIVALINHFTNKITGIGCQLKILWNMNWAIQKYPCEQSTFLTLEVDTQIQYDGLQWTESLGQNNLILSSCWVTWAVQFNAVCTRVVQGMPADLILQVGQFSYPQFCWAGSTVWQFHKNHKTKNTVWLSCDQLQF